MSKSVKEARFGHRGAVYAIDFAIPGDSGPERIVTGGEDAKIIVWPSEKDSAQRSLKIEGHTAPVTALKCHKDLVISASKDKTIRVTNISSLLARTPRTSFCKPHSGAVTSLDISRGVLASGAHDKTVKLFDVRTLSFKGSIVAHNGIVNDVALSDDAALIASVGTDRHIFIHDIRSMNQVADFLAPRNTYPTCVTFAPESDAIVVGFTDGKIRLYDTSSPQVLQTYVALHTERVTAIKFSPERSTIFVSASRDCRIAVVDPMEGLQKQVFEIQDQINCLAFSRKHSGKIAFGCASGNIEAWSVNLEKVDELPPSSTFRKPMGEDLLDDTINQVEVPSNVLTRKLRKSCIPSVDRGDKMNIYGASSRLLKPLASPAVFSVRFARKPRWVPVAKSKMFRVNPRHVMSELEEKEMWRLQDNYKLSLKSIQAFFAEENKRLADTGSVGLRLHQEEEEEFERALAWNDMENARIGNIRRERLTKEISDLETQVLLRIEEHLAEVVSMRRESNAVVAAQMEASKQYITEDMVDKAVEEAFSNPVDYNFAVDAGGGMYRGRTTNSLALTKENVEVWDPEDHSPSVPCEDVFREARRKRDKLLDESQQAVG
ncbi:unnamed protein product [Notodromas monacha]|uniref:Anaphase-promoting complex subunit 4-like WD40 domain-containing protein n=1 Tax=Notodromas monacha TaxID=399045 RepID=A0A7R9BVN9_9CRUS|nr:unnamed protein product [Notodromas monacha]CAG0922647.1 unnamed protein product [Notodromas monacha]